MASLLSLSSLEAVSGPLVGAIRRTVSHIQSSVSQAILSLLNHLVRDLLRLASQLLHRSPLVVHADLSSALHIQLRVLQLLLLIARQIHADEVLLFEIRSLVHLAIETEVARGAHVNRLGAIAHLVSQLLFLRRNPVCIRE